MPSPQFTDRRRPVHGVFAPINTDIIVLVTICTRNRNKCLATTIVHDALVEVWRNAQAWNVGRYMVMPDHIHLFASPTNLIQLENWVMYWKSMFSKKHVIPDFDWQTNHWDRRMRTVDEYDTAWEYVRQNPVRAGLVQSSEDWQYQGELVELRWDSV